MKRVFWSVVIGVAAASATGFVATVLVVLYAVHKMPPAGPEEAVGWDPVALVRLAPPWAWLVLLVVFCLGFGISYHHQAAK